MLADDDVGYSVDETTLEAGQRLFEYRNHRETDYCVAGEGTIEDLSDGRVVNLRPGTIYSAGIGGDHRVTTSTEMTLVCVFTPALIADED